MATEQRRNSWGGGDGNQESDTPSDTPNEETGPEYTITGVSVTYTLNNADLSKLKEPQIAGLIFNGWKIYSLNEQALAGSGLTKGDPIFPETFEFKLPHIFTDIELAAIAAAAAEGGAEAAAAYKFPDSKMLVGNKNPYITFVADWLDDPETAEKKAEIEYLITQMLDNSHSVDALYTDEFLVGSGGTSTEEIALNDAINEAYAAMYGKTVDAEVELEEYECDEAGNLLYFDANDEPVQITEGEEPPEGVAPRHMKVTITYTDINTEDMEAAITKLQKMLDDPVYKNVSLDFALSKIQIPSGVENWRSVTIVKSGTYKIEITGANGGHTWTKSNFAVFGGNGGHVVAQKQFNAGDVIKVRVGREGAGVAKLDAINNSLVRDNTVNQQAVKPGGWPNGGSGGASYKTSIAGSGGGGATEVYYAGEYGSEKALDESKLAGSDIILVAGGGGGAASSTRLINNDGPAPGIRGGNAGPEPEPAICTGGGNAGRIADSPQAYTLAAPLSAPYSDIGTSGLRTLFLTVSGNTTYAYGEYAPDSYVIYGGNDGKGANGRNHDGYWEGTGGGGGGYAGGNAIKSASAGATGSGGGGSNYVANDFTTVTNETSATYGDGAFSIEWVVSN